MAQKLLSLSHQDTLSLPIKMHFLFACPPSLSHCVIPLFLVDIDIRKFDDAIMPQQPYPTTKTSWDVRPPIGANDLPQITF